MFFLLFIWMKSLENNTSILYKCCFEHVEAVSTELLLFFLQMQAPSVYFEPPSSDRESFWQLLFEVRNILKGNDILCRRATTIRIISSSPGLPNNNAQCVPKDFKELVHVTSELLFTDFCIYYRAAIYAGKSWLGCTTRFVIRNLSLKSLSELNL